MPGWEVAATRIDALSAYPCNTEAYTVDVNADGKVDLVFQSTNLIDGNKLEWLPNYTAITFDEKAGWTSRPFDLHRQGGTVLFVDVNGDGLPDAVESGFEDQQLRTFINNGNGFQPPVSSLTQPIVGGADAFITLAMPIDYDSDGRQDLLVPLLMNGTESAPSWMILRSSGGGKFKLVDTNIPFDTLLTPTGITVAHPSVPRVTDINGDGAQDVVRAPGRYLHHLPEPRRGSRFAGLGHRRDERPRPRCAGLPAQRERLVRAPHGPLDHGWDRGG